MNIRLAGLFLGILAVILSLGASIAFGKSYISLQAVADAFISFDGSREHLIIRTVRVPRALIAMAVGSSLALAGGIMQAVTRNALAGPEIFGISNGAALAIVITLFLAGSAHSFSYTGAALIGAGLAGLIVYFLGSMGSGGMTSVKLIVAGATINLLLSSLMQGILIFSEQSMDEMRFWLAGSLTGRNLQLFIQVLPLMLAGIAGGLAISKQLNLISLGEEAAQGLGQNVKLVKAAAFLVIMLLAGGAIAIAGPIGFVGLAVPHIARSIVGVDYRWILPYSVVLGALLLLLADIGARFVLPSQELPAGVITALLGAPFLIYLAQRRG